MPALTGKDYGASRSLHTARRARELEEARRDAFEERAAIIEEGAKVDRATAERWARRCVDHVRGAV